MPAHRRHTLVTCCARRHSNTHVYVQMWQRGKPCRSNTPLGARSRTTYFPRRVQHYSPEYNFLSTETPSFYEVFLFKRLHALRNHESKDPRRILARYLHDPSQYCNMFHCISRGCIRDMTILPTQNRLIYTTEDDFHPVLSNVHGLDQRCTLRIIIRLITSVTLPCIQSWRKTGIQSSSPRVLSLVGHSRSSCRQSMW